jgi:uncharacterized phage-associated protein
MQNLANQELKLKEAIHYLFYLSNGNLRKLNKTKINKILYLFEGIMYIRTAKKPISIKFIKKKHGPISPDINKALTELKNTEKLKINNKNENWITKAANIPKISYLSIEEIKLLSKLYSAISSSKTKTANDITHTKYWKTLNQNDEVNPIFILEMLAKIRKPKEDEIEEITYLHELYKENKVTDKIKNNLLSTNT